MQDNDTPAKNDFVQWMDALRKAGKPILSTLYPGPGKWDEDNLPWIKTVYDYVDDLEAVQFHLWMEMDPDATPKDLIERLYPYLSEGTRQVIGEWDEDKLASFAQELSEYGEQVLLERRQD